MASLAPLATWYQFGEPTPNHNEACGQNAVASILVALGKLPANAQAPLAVDGWMRAQGWSGLAANGTEDYMLVAALEHWGVGAVGSAAGFGYLATALNSGHYAIVLVGSDHVGHPVPNAQAATGHWVAVYASDGGYAIANSGSGHDEQYTAAYFQSAYRGIVVEAMAPAQHVENTPAVTDNDIARLAIGVARAALIGEGPGTPGEGAAIEQNVAAVSTAPETGIEALIAECQNDGRYIPGRVAALEAWAKSQSEAAEPTAAPAADTSALQTQVTALADLVATLAAKLAAIKEAA